MSAEVCVIVAKNSDNAIGYKGDLLYRLKGDMVFFKNITQEVPDEKYKNAVIMGHNTWKSIPHKFRPLKNRINVVLTNNDTIVDQTDDVIISNQLTSVIEDLKKNENIYRIFIIGGERLYNEAINQDMLDKLYITNILYKLPSNMTDTFFPDFDQNNWILESSSQTFSEETIIVPLNKKDIVSYNFMLFTKNNSF